MEKKQIRLMAALKMFELGKVSSGKAAELAGLEYINDRANLLERLNAKFCHETKSGISRPSLNAQ